MDNQPNREEEFLTTNERAKIYMELLSPNQQLKVQSRGNDITLEVFDETFLITLNFRQKGFDLVPLWIVSPLSQIDRPPFQSTTLEIALSRCIELALKH